MLHQSAAQNVQELAAECGINVRGCALPSPQQQRARAFWSLNVVQNEPRAGPRVDRRSRLSLPQLRGLSLESASSIAFSAFAQRLPQTVAWQCSAARGNSTFLIHRQLCSLSASQVPFCNLEIHPKHRLHRERQSRHDLLQHAEQSARGNVGAVCSPSRQLMQAT